MALLYTFRVAVRVPVACGANVMLRVQVDCGARLVPQVFVCAKSPPSAPVNVGLPMVSVVSRLFRRVTVFASLVVPIDRVAKVRDAGLAVAWATPVPLSAEVKAL